MARSLLHTFLGGGVGTAKTVTFDLTANEALEKGDVVAATISGDDGVLRKAQSQTNQVIGIVSNAIPVVSGGTCKIVQSGLTQVNMTSAPTTSDVGRPVFLSTTHGKASLTAPSSSGHSVIRLGYLAVVNGTSSPTIVLSINHIVHLG